MDMTIAQLAVFYLVLNQKVMTKRELLDGGYKIRTLDSLVVKELLQSTVIDGLASVMVTTKAFVFESSMRRLRIQHPNVNQEGEGTYMMRLAKKVVF
jgi:hypothetical protein